jgi:hypothetical protein
VSNTSLSRATSQHVVEIHARVVASAAGCVKHIAHIYHDFILDFQHSFYFFPNLLFALSRFVFFTNFYSLPVAFLFVARILLFYGF